MTITELTQHIAAQLPDSPLKNDWMQIGLPSTKDEQWRYTSILRLFPEGLRVGGTPVETQNTLLPLEGTVLEITSKGVEVRGSEVDAIRVNDSSAEKSGPYTSSDTGVLATLLAEKTHSVLVQKNLQHPLYIVVKGNEAGTISGSSLLLTLAPGVHAHIIEQHQGVEGNVHIHEMLTNISEGSTLTQLVIADEGAAHQLITVREATIPANAAADIFTYTTAPGLTRHELQGALMKPGADITIHGLQLGQGTSHQDTSIEVSHYAPHGTSGQFFRGIYDDKSTGVFMGMIYVEQDAQKTAATQESKNLMVSEGARVYVKPQLEIYADDVTCAHGATTGFLNEEGMYYLRTRGLSEADARAIMIEGFLHEALDRLQDRPYYSLLTEHLHSHIRHD